MMYTLGRKASIILGQCSKNTGSFRDTLGAKKNLGTCCSGAAQTRSTDARTSRMGLQRSVCSGRFFTRFGSCPINLYICYMPKSLFVMPKSIKFPLFPKITSPL